MNWFEAFAWTIALEVPIYAMVLLRKLSWMNFGVVAIGGSALTHPFVWLLVPRLERTLLSYNHAVWVMEALAMSVEGALGGLVLTKSHVSHPWIRGVLASLAANSFSWLVGARISEWLAAP